MKKIFTFLICLIMFVGLSAQTYTASPGATIPDANCDATNEFDQDLAGEGLANLGSSFGLETVEVTISHSWVSDLDLYLISPDGTEVELSTDNGGSGDDYTNTVFDCNAATAITSGSAPFTGSYIPEGDLADINNGQDPNGVWTLRACDDASGDEGTLDSWSITFGNSPCAPPVAPDNDLCADAIEVVNPSTTAGTTVNATDTGEPPTCITSVTVGGVWYTYVSDINETITVELCGAPYDSKIGVYTGSCGNFTCVIGEEDDSANCGGNDPSVDFTTTAGNNLVPETYYIYVHGFSDGQGTFDLSLSGAPLPVELTSFEGEVMENYNMLMWETASEENTKMHVIERSSDGRGNWEVIGETAAAGNSFQSLHYTMKDINPIAQAYYRVKSVDFDDYTDYSEVIMLEREIDRFEVLNVAPNPASTSVSINVQTPKNGLYTIRVNNMVGQTMYIEQANLDAGIHSKEINVADFANGVYFITIENGFESLIHKIVKQ